MCKSKNKVMRTSYWYRVNIHNEGIVSLFLDYKLGNSMRIDFDINFDLFKQLNIKTDKKNCSKIFDNFARG